MGRTNRPKPQDNSTPGTKLFVANLSYAVDDEWLTEIFEQAGEVREATVVRDDSGRSRGFGFVTMSNVEAASEAETKIHGEDVDGRDLRVEMAGNSTRKGPRRDRGGGGGDGEMMRRRMTTGKTFVRGAGCLLFFATAIVQAHLVTTRVS